MPHISHKSDTKPNGWNALLPRREIKTPQKIPESTKLAVIGAGVTGLSCARRLALLHPDEEILLLDARQVGQSSSGKNSGFAVDTSHFPGKFDPKMTEEYRRVSRVNHAGLNLLGNLVSEHKINCQWSECGFHRTAADKISGQELEFFKEHLQKLEIPHQLLDQDALKEQLGTEHYRSALYVHDGVLLQPAALVRGIADCLPANITLLENQPVQKIDTTQSPKIHLSQATINAEKLFITTGHEIPALGFLKRRMVGSTLTASLTRVLNDDEFEQLGSLEQWGVLSFHSGGATIRLTQDRRISIRNTAEYSGGKLLSSAQLSERKKIHRTAFNQRFPKLSHVEFEHSWSCVEGLSANFTNFFGRNNKKIFYAAGYNGAGISRGTAFGHALAEFASGGQSQLINDCQANPKATWLPPRPFLDIGAYFTMRKRFRGVGRDQ